MISPLERFAEGVRQRPLRPYDRLYDHPETEAIAAAEAARSVGRYVYRDIAVSLDGPARVSDVMLSRSSRMAIEAWHHLEPLFIGLDRTGDAFFRDALTSTADQWVRNAGLRWKRDLETGANSQGDPEETFSDYGFAISARTYRLAYLVDSMIVSGLPCAEWSGLLTAFLEHAHLLDEDEAIWDQHNHGLFQLAHLLTATSRFYNIGVADRLLSGGLGTEDIYWRAQRRFRTLLGSQVKPDGALPEHSAGYQILVTRLVAEVVGSGLASDEALTDLLARMQALCRWMHDPDGDIVALGDKPSSLDNPASTPPTGPPDRGMALFREGGYWFVREPGSTPETSYLAQTSAFHSRIHKHCDTGAVVWHDLGRPILIDPGSFGYAGRTSAGSPLQRDGFWYDDPRRVHVESARAHNTIEVDGRNHRRFRQEAFGATLSHTAMVEGVWGSRCTIPNAGASQHHRFVLLKPGEWLMVIDTCRFAGMPSTVRQWFQFHPRWQPGTAADALRLCDGSVTLSVVPLLADTAVERVWRGDRIDTTDPADPGYRGWWSPAAGRFEPCTTVSVVASGTFLSLATLLAAGDTTPIIGRASVNVTHRAFLFAWQTGTGTHRLRLETEGLAAPHFSIEYAKRP